MKNLVKRDIIALKWTGVFVLLLVLDQIIPWYFVQWVTIGLLLYLAFWKKAIIAKYPKGFKTIAQKCELAIAILVVLTADLVEIIPPVEYRNLLSFLTTAVSLFIFILINWGFFTRGMFLYAGENTATTKTNE